MNDMRLKCERMILKVMETLDDPKNNGNSKPNVEFWIEQFAKMTDKEFEQFVTTPLSLYYQTSGLHREPTMININHALDEIGVPLLEEVYMPYKYKNSEGKAVKSKKCPVIYIHMKRMKQLLTKKNGMSIEIKTRDMRTGLLTGHDKNGRESDREFESLAISNLTNTMSELSKSRADAMQDKALLSSTIKAMGTSRLKDLVNDPSDSLSKNLLNVYFIGAGINTTLINVDYMTPHTLLAKKGLKVQRVN